MDKATLLSHIDHTALQPCIDLEAIMTLCREAEEYQVAAACIPPNYVGPAAAAFPRLNICTVVGFPLGYSTTVAKVFEAREALSQGAREIDMVLALGALKSGELNQVAEEIAAVKEVCGNRILKVIIETCYLSRQEKLAACQCVAQGGADYLKTSTGFGNKGAVLEDMALFKEHLPPEVKIKAAGGLSTVADMTDFLLAGAERLGTSKGVKLLCNL